MTYLFLFQCVKFQLLIFPFDVPTHLLILLFRLVLSSPTTAVPGYYVPSQILDELSAGLDVLHHVRPDALKQGVPANKIDYLSMGSADLTAEGIFLCGSYEAYSNHHHALKVKLLIGRDPDYNMFRNLRGVAHPPIYLMS